ncbi:hypothetical protein [Bradyrhizobium jicamae]|uniref:hypothetical protein n=1 Tax=Bradyrhizobium jicamae TaxID=280332 RepID=UPI0012ED41CB|nr:hypothetical protein [Bradyrhizobium jicamae]
MNESPFARPRRLDDAIIDPHDFVGKPSRSTPAKAPVAASRARPDAADFRVIDESSASKTLSRQEQALAMQARQRQTCASFWQFFLPMKYARIILHFG